MFRDKTKQAQKRLESLPCLALQAEQVEFIYSPIAFKNEIIQLIRQAKTRIFVTALYDENNRFIRKSITSPFHHFL